MATTSIAGVRAAGGGKMRTIWFVLSAFVLQGGAGAEARAQSPLSAGVALELGGVQGGEFRDRAKDAVSATLDVRLARIGETSVLLGLRAEQPFMQEAATAICVYGSHGQCLDPPPSLRAVTANVGLRRQFFDRVAIGADVGAGGFAGDNWRGWRGVASGAINVALRLGGPVYFAIGGHALVWSYDGSMLVARTVTYGLRIN